MCHVSQLVVGYIKLTIQTIWGVKNLHFQRISAALLQVLKNLVNSSSEAVGWLFSSEYRHRDDYYYHYLSRS